MKTNRWIACLIVGVGLMWSATAMAQEAGAALDNGGGGTPNVIVKKETNYDFEGDDVEGALVKPDGENFNGEARGKTSSLIKIRGDFVPEMLKSVEDI